MYCLTTLILTLLIGVGRSVHQDEYDFVFPGQDNRRDHSRRIEDDGQISDRFNYNNTIPEIPFELALRLSQAENFDDIVDQLIDKDPSFGLLSNRFGGVERSGAIKPKPAMCQPSPVLINLAKETNFSITPGDLLLPECTRVNRCSGCSGNSLLACKPSETEMQLFQVIHVKYTGGPKFKAIDKVVIPVEVHTKCGFDCAVTEKDCNAVQQYNHAECKCFCTNTDEMKKCEKQHEKKLWDPRNCRCTCRQERTECTTGLRWDDRKCRCVRIAQRRRFVQYNATKSSAPDRRNKYNVDVQPVT